jgi:hypothetical protein
MKSPHFSQHNRQTRLSMVHSGWPHSTGGVAMDHKIIKSRRSKYGGGVGVSGIGPSGASISELDSALLDDVLERGSDGNRAAVVGHGEDRTDSITTMRSDMHQHIASLDSASIAGRNPTRSNSFYDYIISPHDYFLFCLGFSIATVPIVVALSFSATVLSHIRVSGLGNGGFFLGYALCSLSFSKSLVDTLGCKFAIFYGFIGSSIFVLSFLISSALFRPHVNFVYPIGATIGGISQAIMWTAQVLLPPSLSLLSSHKL